MLAAALLVMQAALPSVGDTVWVERTVPGVGTAVLRPQPWSLGTLGQQLGPAIVELGSTGALVRYPLVFWYPGEHQLSMPGPVLVRRDGSSDTLAAAPVRVRVASVLPEGVSRARLEPKGARVPIPLEARTLLPAGLLALVVLLLTGLVALRWRRRGRAPLRRQAVAAMPALTTFQQWAAQGEFRAALHELAWLLSDRMRKSQDLTQTAELQRVLDDISFSSFSPRPDAELAALYQRAARLAA
ncbi:MAG TPA: hypothetical protein VFU23_07620 [Gemmatimonadales bacterium]|nr:hypothetical protein [Gemmatimonadales bacterium]